MRARVSSSCVRRTASHRGAIIAAGAKPHFASDGARPRAYLKMFGDTPLEWQNRAHFMASAAVMRQISSIRAREAPAQARCGRGRVPLDDDVVGGLSLDTSASTDRADDALVRLSARRTQVADREAPVLTNSRGDRQLLGRLDCHSRRRGQARDRNAPPELGIMSAGPTRSPVRACRDLSPHEQRRFLDAECATDIESGAN